MSRLRFTFMLATGLVGWPLITNAWPLSFGLKAGLPVNGLIKDSATGSPTLSSQFSIGAHNGKFIFGPSVELALPAGLSVEFDALHRAFSADLLRAGVSLLAQDSGQAWEFPLLAKYRFSKGLVAPYAEAGFAFRNLSGLGKIDAALTGGGRYRNLPGRRLGGEAHCAAAVA